MWQIAVDEPVAFELLSPRSLDEAVDLAARHGRDCALMAGGSDLLDQLKQHRRTPRYVINLKTIPGLRSLERHGRPHLDWRAHHARRTGAQRRTDAAVRRPRVWPRRVSRPRRSATSARSAGTSCRTRDVRTIAGRGTAIAPAASSVMPVMA